MSTYYYILCHDCKVSCDAARVGRAGPGHLINSDVDVPAFMVAHVGHKVAIVSEHSEEGAGYRDFNSPEPAPPTPEEQAAQKERNEEAQRFQIFSMGCRLREGFGPFYLPPVLYDAIKAKYPDQEFPNFVRAESIAIHESPLMRLPMLPLWPTMKVLPYPPRKRGRYAR